MDITINSMSLIGMLLVSGLLVDDAIIVLENIYRRIEEGESLREAVVNGAEEVMWPVISAVTTTIAAFFPLLLIEGASGEFMSILPKTVIVCLAASLFECLVILPAHYLDLGSRHAAQRRPPGAEIPAVVAVFGAMHLRVDRWIGELRRVYLGALDVVLRHSLPFGALVVALFVLAAGVATHLPVVMFPSEFNNFFVVLEAPTDFGLDRTDAVFRKVEQELDGLLGEILVDYSTFVGRAVTGDTQPYSGANVAMALATIVEREEFILAPERAIALVEARIDRVREAHPEEVVELRALAPRNGPPVGKPIAVRLQGYDYAVTKSIAREMEEYGESIPGVPIGRGQPAGGPREIRSWSTRRGPVSMGSPSRRSRRPSGRQRRSGRDELPGPGREEDFDIRCS
jgi:HAE1 family hydrophobic/amphiphilic exporter-1